MQSIGPSRAAARSTTAEQKLDWKGSPPRYGTCLRSGWICATCGFAGCEREACEMPIQFTTDGSPGYRRLALWQDIVCDVFVDRKSVV